MEIHIPNRGPLTIRHVVLDFNGTLAVDGQIPASTVKGLIALSHEYHVLLATADTFNTAGGFSDELQLEWQRVTTGQDKEEIVRNLKGGVAVIGNGANDALMFKAADLAIAVLGKEGLATGAMLSADIVVSSADDGMELLLHPRRLIATMRL